MSDCHFLVFSNSSVKSITYKFISSSENDGCIEIQRFHEKFRVNEKEKLIITFPDDNYTFSINETYSLDEARKIWNKLIKLGFKNPKTHLISREVLDTMPT